MFRCKAQGCDAVKHKAKGFCRFHYERFRAGKPLDDPRRRFNPGAACEVDGCEGRAKALGLCHKHYARIKKHGDASKHGKGRIYGSGKEWHASPEGYIVRYEPNNPNAGPNGQVYQHRHVMSDIMKRPLLRHESVHHRNGDRSDNRPENLELWSSHQPAGQSVQDKVAWAKEILALYDPGSLV